VYCSRLRTSFFNSHEERGAGARVGALLLSIVGDLVAPDWIAAIFSTPKRSAYRVFHVTLSPLVYISYYVTIANRHFRSDFVFTRRRGHGPLRFVFNSTSLKPKPPRRGFFSCEARRMGMATDLILWIGAMNLVTFCAVILAVTKHSGDR
jgi:hypothetical protein